MNRKTVRRQASTLFKIAVGGSVAALGGGAALAQVGTSSPAPAEASSDHVTLDLEDGTIDVAVDEEIAPDLDGDDDGVEADSVDEPSVESVDEDSVDEASVESVDEDSVDEDSVDEPSVESVDEDSVDEASVESVDEDSVDEDSVDEDSASGGDDD